MNFVVAGLIIGSIIGFTRMYLWDKPKRNVAIISIFPTMVACLMVPMICFMFINDLFTQVTFIDKYISNKSYLDIMLCLIFVMSSVAIYFIGMLYVKRLDEVFYDDPVIDDTKTGVTYAVEVWVILAVASRIIISLYDVIPKSTIIVLSLLRFVAFWLILVPFILYLAYLAFDYFTKKLM